MPIGERRYSPVGATRLLVQSSLNAMQNTSAPHADTTLNNMYRLLETLKCGNLTFHGERGNRHEYQHTEAVLLQALQEAFPGRDTEQAVNDITAAMRKRLNVNAIFLSLVMSLAATALFGLGFWWSFIVGGATFLSYALFGVGVMFMRVTRTISLHKADTDKQLRRFLKSNNVNVDGVADKDLGVPPELEEKWDDYAYDHNISKFDLYANKARLISWVVNWPGVVISFFASDLLQIIAEKLSGFFKGIYYFFYDWVASRLQVLRNRLYGNRNVYKFREDLEKDVKARRQAAAEAARLQREADRNGLHGSRF